MVALLATAIPGLAADVPKTLREQSLLPTGLHLDPAGQSFDLGSLPLAMALSPQGDRLAVLLSGWREQGFRSSIPVREKYCRRFLRRPLFWGLLSRRTARSTPRAAMRIRSSATP